MKMNEKRKRAVNLIINSLAEDRYQNDERCDSDIYGWFWSDCVDYAIDDFGEDPKGYLDTYDIFVNDKEAKEVYWWAIENVNTGSIRKYMEK